MEQVNILKRKRTFPVGSIRRPRAYVATFTAHHRDQFDRMTADHFLSRYSEFVVQVRR